MSTNFPHSLEAEEFLLSSCLIDGAEVVSRCNAANIRPASFYDPKHAIAFDCLQGLHKRGEPISTSVLAVELEKSGQLQKVGGYPFILQISNRVPTTAQTSYFIATVKDHEIRRSPTWF